MIEFLDYCPLERGDAKSICAAVTTCLDKYSTDWRDKLVSFGADGAPVNMGCNSGAATQLRGAVPHLVAVHGCAHRLELAIKSTSRSCS